LSRQVLTSQESQVSEIDAFKRLIRAATVLRRELEAEVLVPNGLTMNDFEALVHLSHAHEGRLKRIDLATLLSLTPSGVTRLLDGLQTAGLVEKQECPEDQRVSWAVLSTEGARTLECVGARHAEALRSLFSRALDDAEVAQLSELLGRLPGVGAGSCSASA
jgi:DNA-binding MarR family transcriptional regulator